MSNKLDLLLTQINPEDNVIRENFNRIKVFSEASLANLVSLEERILALENIQEEPPLVIRYSSNAAQAFAHNTLTYLNFEDVEFDEDSLCTTTPWEFTAPSDGKYFIGANFTFASTTGYDVGEESDIYIYLDGVIKSNRTYPHSGNSADPESLCIFDVYNLITGNKIRIRGIQRTGASVNLNGSTSQNYVFVLKIN